MMAPDAARPPPDALAEALDMTPPSRAADKDEADTCRICRGEGSADEPLFFPCKCSGSIKYVHQECLMEWLSHTQKKHCELCKTSFRFTKLYHPGMPNRIPTTVFLRRAALHTANMLLTWCRGVLVACVWLLLLPWCMRVVWRSLFWVGDGGWSHDVFLNSADASDPSTGYPFGLGSPRPESHTNSTTLRTPFFSYTYTSNDSSVVYNPLWNFAWNFLLFGFVSPRLYLPVHDTNQTVANVTAEPFSTRNPSLLSDVPFFKWFDSHTANRFIVDVLEGQIITLLVVVAFILVFLIREWVVQQQPVINMVALGNNAAPGAAHQEAEAQQHPAPEEDESEDEDEPIAQNEQANEAEVRDLEGPLAPEHENAPHGENRPSRASSPHRRREELMRRIVRGEIPDDLKTALKSGSAEDVTRIFVDMGLVDVDTPSFENVVREYLHSRIFDDQPVIPDSDAEASDSRDVPAPVQSSSLSRTTSQPHNTDVADAESSAAQRPIMPSRDRSFVATGIRRSLEENNDWSLEGVPTPPQASSSRDVPQTWEDEADTGHDGTNHKAVSDQGHDSEHSSESWQQVADINAEHDSNQVLEGAGLHDSAPTNAAAAITQETSLPREFESPAEDADVVEEQSAFDEDLSSDDSEVEAELEQMLQEQEAIAAEEPPHMPVDARPAAAHQPAPDALNRALEWIFGDIAPAGPAAEEPGNDEQVVRNIADEPPFVPFAANPPQQPVHPPAQDAEVAAAAARAGFDVNDQEAIEDAEDLEGILELIGMQGPLIGLLQNVVFSAVLISATLACAVWVPYLLGKVVILVMGSPVSLLIKLPLQIVATLTDLIVDMVLVVMAGVTYWCTQLVSTVVSLSAREGSSAAVDGRMSAIATSTRSLAQGAIDRIGTLFMESPLSPRPDYGRLSVSSHAALRSLQNSTSLVFNETSNFAGAIIERVSADSFFALLWRLLSSVPGATYLGFATVYNQLHSLLSWIWTAKSYKITLDLDLGYNTTAATYTSLERWTASDRLIAIFAGYACFAVAGAVYLKRGSPISNSQQGQRIESIISEILQQAGGVLKVILIISIEMLAFPLYCGLLLDLAMLPLFKNATLYTRWQFAQESPWTSGFVHWFIGTCYMFHFALFVSMCRKIMRKGVLYFIRDPDDPTFHPVRDVLERSVTTQLRKIAFSALVYGALVIVCLGGVVWSLSRATYNVLPIHWTTEAPSLEFPLDLLFYNFLTPVIIKFYKPSESLHSIYKWWFKTCASHLNLSNFLFGDKVEQEGQAGKYVRAPASDQARIPKGQAVFIEVDKDNNRKDGQNEGGVHNNMDLVTMVFIPSWFRLRIFVFVVTIWIFMGLSGVSVTIIPLLFGRYLFSLVLPPNVEMNDIHAFSLGIYTLGSIIYSGYHLYRFISSLDRPTISPTSTLTAVLNTVSHISLRVLRFAYVWTALVFIIPTLFAILIELYFLMPLHAYLGPSEPHVVHIIQDWTLGFLYARLAARLVLANRQTRPARAFDAVIRDGYMYPNARIATRCFVLPVVSLWLVAIAVPASLAWTTSRTMYYGAPEQTKNMVWRFSFPAVGFSLVAMWASRETMKMLNRWRLVVRDEVYLIGERLHNFGEKKAGLQSRAVEEEVRRRANEESGAMRGE